MMCRKIELSDMYNQLVSIYEELSYPDYINHLKQLETLHEILLSAFEKDISIYDVNEQHEFGDLYTSAGAFNFAVRRLKNKQYFLVDDPCFTNPILGVYRNIFSSIKNGDSFESEFKQLLNNPSRKDSEVNDLFFELTKVFSRNKREFDRTMSYELSQTETLFQDTFRNVLNEKKRIKICIFTFELACTLNLTSFNQVRQQLLQNDVLCQYVCVLPSNLGKLNYFVVWLLEGNDKLSQEELKANILSRVRKLLPVDSIKILNYLFPKALPDEQCLITLNNKKLIDEVQYWVISFIGSIDKIISNKQNIVPVVDVKKDIFSKKLESRTVVHEKGIELKLADVKDTESIEYLRACKRYYPDYGGTPNVIYQLHFFLEVLKYSPIMIVHRLQTSSKTSKGNYTYLGILFFQVIRDLRSFNMLDFFYKENNCNNFVNIFGNYSQLQSSLMDYDSIIQLEEKLKKFQLQMKLRDAQHYTKRLKAYRNYVKWIFKQDTIMLEMNLKFIKKSADQEVKASLWFTEFMRYAKQAKPLIWLRGYILRWEYQDRLKLQGETDYSLCMTWILFFENNKKMAFINLTCLLEEYIENYCSQPELDRFNIQKVEVNRNLSGEREERDNTIIDVKDTKIQQIVLNEMIPAFCYLEEFCDEEVLQLLKKKKKRFQKGQILKNLG